MIRYGAANSERLLVRTQVEFMSPRTAMLLMQLPISFCDGVGIQQPVAARACSEFRSGRSEALAVYAAIDHHMRDVNSLRSVFSRDALGQGPQACLRRSERNERPTTAKRGGGTGEQ